MSQELVELKWKRPNTVEYPKVWRTFKARDLESNNLVEYCIQDLPETHYEAAMCHMTEQYLRDEPLSQVFGAYGDADYAAACRFAYRSLLPQKTSLVCFRAGSDEIAGICMGYIITKGERFYEDVHDRIKSLALKRYMEICELPYTVYKFDPLKYYGVMEYFSDFGLSVDERYRGRNIGYHLLAARQELCRACDVQLQSVAFTSEISSRCADKAGFELNVSMSYDEIDRLHPEYNIKSINAKEYSIRSQRIV